MSDGEGVPPVHTSAYTPSRHRDRLDGCLKSEYALVCMARQGALYMAGKIQRGRCTRGVHIVCTLCGMESTCRSKSCGTTRMHPSPAVHKVRAPWRTVHTQLGVWAPPGGPPGAQRASHCTSTTSWGRTRDALGSALGGHGGPRHVHLVYSGALAVDQQRGDARANPSLELLHRKVYRKVVERLVLGSCGARSQHRGPARAPGS